MIRGDYIGVTLEELRAYEKVQQIKSKNENSISPLAWERYKGSGLDINKFIYIYDNYEMLKEKLEDSNAGVKISNI